MADLTDLQAAQATKIVGSDPTGVETNAISGSANGDLGVADGISSGGLQGNLSLTTANTAYEVKVGAGRLANRKCVTVVPTDFDMYWGYNNTVTTSTGTPLAKGQFIGFALDPTDSAAQLWLVCASANRNARITEAP